MYTIIQCLHTENLLGSNKTMVKIFNILLLFVSTTMVVSCMRVVETKFDEDNLFHAVSDNSKSTVELSKAIPSKEYNNGVIADFNTGVKNNWWGSDRIVLSGKKDALVINASSVGLAYDRFGYRFHTFCDFSENNILRVRARSEGNSIPVLRIDLKDAYGNTTNHIDTKTRILICDDYVDYFFKFESKFEQGWPTRTAVDKKRISELELFINPGGPGYTGTIYIDEITVIDEKKINSNAENTCIVNVQNNSKIDMKYWWVNDAKYSLKYSDEDSAIVVISRGTGAHYESFGRGFSSANFSENSVLKVRIKAEGETAPDFRLDMVDADGNATNGEAIIKTIPNDNKYRDYFFDFKDKFYQGWPQTKKVDEKNIKELMLFINPGSSNYIGKIFISDIEVVTNFIRSYDTKKSLVQLDKNINIVQSNKLDLWWVGEGGTIKVQDSYIEIIAEHTTPQETMIGSGFDTKDLSIRNQFKLVVKSSHTDFEVKLFDDKGNSTEKVSPLTVQKLDNGFSEYYFSFTEALKKINLYKVGGITIYYGSETSNSNDTSTILREAVFFDSTK